MPLPHLAPTYSPRHHSKKVVYIKRNATQSRRSFSYSRPRKGSGRNPVGIACPKTHKPQVNPQSPITPKRQENALTGDPDPRGIETQHIASRAVWRYASNSRREPSAKRPDRNARTAAQHTQSAATEPHGRREPRAKHRDRAARLDALIPRTPIFRIPNYLRRSPARTNARAGAITGRHCRRAG